MQNRKRDTDVQNRLLDSVREGDGGMFWENSIETCILSRVKRSPAQVGFMRQVLGAGALGRPIGIRWRGRQEGGSGWGIYINPWLIHASLWQKPLQYCKVISLQLIKINGKKKKKAECRRIDAFELWCWRRLLRVPWKEIQPVHPKGDQSWVFIARTDVEAETPILWPPDVKNQLIWKDPDAGKNWRQEEKGTTENEMAGWHNQRDGCESE